MEPVRSKIIIGNVIQGQVNSLRIWCVTFHTNEGKTWNRKYYSVYSTETICRPALPPRAHRLWGPPASCPSGTGGSLPGVRRSEREDHASPSSAEVKNA